jgi:hypothetical protein
MILGVPVMMILGVPVMGSDWPGPARSRIVACVMWQASLLLVRRDEA